MLEESQQGILDSSAGSEAVQDTKFLEALGSDEKAGQMPGQSARQIDSRELEEHGIQQFSFPEPAGSSREEHGPDKKSPSQLGEAGATGIEQDDKRGLDTITSAGKLENGGASNEQGVSSRDATSEAPLLAFKKGWRNQYVPVAEQKLRNNLSPSVGYLEFANATDFAANVWNTIPVPTFAAVLMALGGVTAIILSCLALKDGVLCWKNIQLLRKERAELLTSVDDEEKVEGKPSGRSLSIKLEVNRREIGQEFVDRLSMDAFMGFSAFLVGIGTLMAIGGANPRVYHASNLLSGYIGNSPSAFWGLGNTLWSAYLFRRASRHYIAGMRHLQHEAVKNRLNKRTTSVQMHSVLMGLATLVSAPAGMVTATHWEGYPPLIPCIILAKWGNVVWRKRLGYTRFPIRQDLPSVDPQDLTKEIEWVISLQEGIREDPKTNMADYVTKYRGQGSTTAFMSRCGLLEDLCIQLLNASVIKHGDKDSIVVDQTMVEDCERAAPCFAVTANSLFEEKAQRTLAYKERYLLELLGASIYDACSASQKACVRREDKVWVEDKQRIGLASEH
jgi:hypothetical protein